MKSKLIVPALVAVMGGTALLGATTTFAQTSQPTKDTIVQKLAEKFGLQENDVQAVFDEVRVAHQAEMEARMTAELDQYVKDGKITEAQKQLIIAKRQEMKEKHQSLHDQMAEKTPEERKTLMDQHRAELEKWAEENGIDVKYVMGKFVGRFKGRGHGGMMPMEAPAAQ